MYIVVEETAYRDELKFTVYHDKMKAWQHYCRAVAEDIEENGGDKYTIEDACTMSEYYGSDFSGSSAHIYVQRIVFDEPCTKVVCVTNVTFKSKDY